MATYSTDRRSMLKIIGAVGTTCAYPFASEDLFGQTQPDPAAEHHHAAPADQQEQTRYFNAVDYRTISRIAELIIPQTETPGAIEAGVPAFIDSVVARNSEHQFVMADGLRWLDAQAERLKSRKFIALSEEEQLSILEPLCEAHDSNPDHRARNVQFFSLLKNLTADGYYTSQIGLMKELQYEGNKILSSYPECERQS